MTSEAKWGFVTKVITVSHPPVRQIQGSQDSLHASLVNRRKRSLHGGRQGALTPPRSGRRGLPERPRARGVMPQPNAIIRLRTFSVCACSPVRRASRDFEPAGRRYRAPCGAQRVCNGSPLARMSWARDRAVRASDCDLGPIGRSRHCWAVKPRRNYEGAVLLSVTLPHVDVGRYRVADADLLWITSNPTPADAAVSDLVTWAAQTCGPPPPARVGDLEFW